MRCCSSWLRGAWSPDKNQQFRTIGVGRTLQQVHRDSAPATTPGVCAIRRLDRRIPHFTSHNLLAPDTYDHLDATGPQELTGALDRYCEQTPERTFVLAPVRDVGGELREQRLEQRPPPGTRKPPHRPTAGGPLIGYDLRRILLGATSG